MSAAATIHAIEESFEGREVEIVDDAVAEAEREALEKLTELHPAAAAGPLIAIDLDDVLSQTNIAVAECTHTLLHFQERLLIQY